MENNEIKKRCLPEKEKILETYLILREMEFVSATSIKKEKGNVSYVALLANASTKP